MSTTPQEEAVDLLTSREIDYELMLVHLALFRPDILFRICKAIPTTKEEQIKKYLCVSAYPTLQENWEYFWEVVEPGQKRIMAIKMYKEYTGHGLKESKDALDAVWAILGKGSGYV
jgi:hypothetical protein